MTTMALGPSRPYRVPLDAPWEWLAAGWRDLWRRPVASLSYGVAFTAMSIAVVACLYLFDLLALLLPLAAGFLLLGPMLAVGLYEISRRLEEKEAIDAASVIVVRRGLRMELVWLGGLVMGLFLIWIRIATLLYALFFGMQAFPGFAASVNELFFTYNGLAMLAVGSAVGAVLAALVFAVSAFSVPMLLDRPVSIVEAVSASVRVVRDNPATIALWASIVVVLVAVGVATLFVGLAITFPLLGHATWHAYRDVMPAAEA